MPRRHIPAVRALKSELHAVRLSSDSDASPPRIAWATVVTDLRQLGRDSMAPNDSFDEHARPPSGELLQVDGMSVAPPVTERQARALATVGRLADEPADLARV